MERGLLAEADRSVGDVKAFLVIDDAALPKNKLNSAGVAPQYASSQGETANCQSLVSVTLAAREVPLMVGLRLFLPESLSDEPVRTSRAHVVTDRQVAMSKPDIAIAEIDGSRPPASTSSACWPMQDRSCERKYYVSNLPPDTPLRQLAAIIKARWVCGTGPPATKEELGHDHFKGRSWRGYTDMHY